MGEGRRYWRTLEDLAERPGAERWLSAPEFAEGASENPSPRKGGMSRRNLLKLMGASLALAGLQGCAPPDETIEAYVDPAAGVTPGVPKFYASAFELGGFGQGILVKTREGRPIKIEGNEAHPGSLGATTAFGQASLLGLYDPDRSRSVKRAGQVNSWTGMLADFNDRVGQGAGRIRILTRSTTSPTLIEQIQLTLKRFPQARWHIWEPFDRDSANEGLRLALGRDAAAVYRFDHATRIVSLDSDFLLRDPGSLAYARQFIDGRQARKASAEAKNRLYAIYSTPTITSAAADNRLKMKPSEVEGFARALAARLGAGGPSPQPSPGVPGEGAKALEAIAADLKSAGRGAVVIAGEEQPAAVHALAALINRALGSEAVQYVEAIEAIPTDAGGKAITQLESIRQLAADINAGSVDALVVLGGNPAFDAPADLNFVAAMKKVPLTIHLGQHEDETAFNSLWHAPEAHYLEAWGDVRAFDGTTSIVQPAIQPLFGGRSAIELLAALRGETSRTGYEMVRDHWRTAWKATDAVAFDDRWRTTVGRGVVENSVAAPVGQVSNLPPVAVENGGRQVGNLPHEGVEVVFRPDPSVWDGRFANNGWLQELPKPLTKVTWDNLILISEKTARKLGLLSGNSFNLNSTGSANGLVVKLGNGEVEGPLWVMPGHAHDCVTVLCGYGRRRAGQVAKGAGFDGYGLRTSSAMAYLAGVAVASTGKRVALACTQLHQRMEGRDLVRVGTSLEQISGNGHGNGHAQKTGEKAGENGKHLSLSLYPEQPDGGHIGEQKYAAWGMVIDTSACIGCNACVVACQSENNIPVVGKDQVIREREMHWLRIDTYHSAAETALGAEGDELAKMFEDPHTVFQPLPCMHCEKAPCEVVCPVEATTHSREGLNEMTYNRCIGTRYCSNNCPYKVRRFNFLQYSDETTESLKLMRNPEVTVRSRGVMEKCTYCVQRLNQNRIEIKKLDAQWQRKIDVAGAEQRPAMEKQRDQIREQIMGSLQTACQQACPTEAIIFGDLNYRHPDGKASAVRDLRDEPHHYGLLMELQTQPRTTYLGRVENPNPNLKSEI